MEKNVKLDVEYIEVSWCFFSAYSCNQMNEIKFFWLLHIDWLVDHFRNALHFPAYTNQSVAVGWDNNLSVGMLFGQVHLEMFSIWNASLLKT